jgi:hypothetical protein
MRRHPRGNDPSTGGFDTGSRDERATGGNERAGRNDRCSSDVRGRRDVSTC